MATAHSATVSAPPAVPSPWSPLRQPLFRALWIASVVSNVGTWMQNVGAAWLMTSLAPSPAMVALVQAATALPLFLLALPAGALADVVDRRRLLLATQVGMAVAAAALGALTLAEAIGPWALLAFTFVLGVGAALSMPAWQAIMPDLVPRSQLAAVVALNGISLNVALALGAALGGAVITAVGPAAAFLVSATQAPRDCAGRCQPHRPVPGAAGEACALTDPRARASPGGSGLRAAWGRIWWGPDRRTAARRAGSA